jgi:hypothetical protein
VGVDDASDAGKALTNAEIRRWYLEQVSRIPALNREWLRQELSAKERAEKAWGIRHDARLQSRVMMADPAEIELLRQRDVALYGHPDGPTFESLVAKLRDAGLEDNAIYEAIIEGAYRTDSGINRSLGL